MCFFFQAEDGIRDRDVTGVQTCALPISTKFLDLEVYRALQWNRSVTPLPGCARGSRRSEERRVGKECRFRWSRVNYKINKEKIGDEWRSNRGSTKALRACTEWFIAVSDQ